MTKKEKLEKNLLSKKQTDIVLAFYEKVEGTPPPKESEWVYFLYDEKNQIYKIGFSKWPIDRLNAIRSGSGNKNIYLIEAVLMEEGDLHDTPANIVEYFIKTWFKDKKVHGEWFKLSTKDLANLKRLVWEVGGADCLLGHKNILNCGYKKYEISRYRGDRLLSNGLFISEMENIKKYESATV